jgi:hypothetical protein
MLMAKLYDDSVGGGRHLTPGITRRAGPLQEFDKQRVCGRVHAVVGRRFGVKGTFARIYSWLKDGGSNSIPTAE